MPLALFPEISNARQPCSGRPGRQSGRQSRVLLPTPVGDVKTRNDKNAVVSPPPPSVCHPSPISQQATSITRFHLSCIASSAPIPFPQATGASRPQSTPPQTSWSLRVCIAGTILCLKSDRTSGCPCLCQHGPSLMCSIGRCVGTYHGPAQILPASLMELRTRNQSQRAARHVGPAEKHPPSPKRRGSCRSSL